MIFNDNWTYEIPKYADDFVLAAYALCGESYWENRSMMYWPRREAREAGRAELARFIESLGKA